MHESFSDLGFEALEDVLQLAPPSKDALAQFAQDTLPLWTCHSPGPR